MIGHPLALPAGGGLVALLALLGLLRWRQRKTSEAQHQTAEPDTEAYENAEGQTVDTSEDAPVSSMMYSPSQLDAGGDVDPVAEADVYLAYGRDKQAEEILLESIRLHPDRLPVRLKLLEIYAQRNDIPSFNALAATVQDLTEGMGPEWQQAREMGLRVDPANPLYLSAAESFPTAGPATEPP
ncbi:peptidoglycan-binding protein, partial [Arthrospira platensis SPKY1]|nr:peptidoglycan-binding protein [Arthrospira platensis SPKY1]